MREERGVAQCFSCVQEKSVARCNALGATQGEKKNNGECSVHAHTGSHVYCLSCFGLIVYITQPVHF